MPAIKTVGRSGQISLGKEFAGQHVLIDEIEPGVWILTVAWAETNPPTEADLFILEEKVGT